MLSGLQVESQRRRRPLSALPPAPHRCPSCSIRSYAAPPQALFVDYLTSSYLEVDKSESVGYIFGALFMFLWLWLRGLLAIYSRAFWTWVLLSEQDGPQGGQQEPAPAAAP